MKRGFHGKYFLIMMLKVKIVRVPHGPLLYFTQEKYPSLWTMYVCMYVFKIHGVLSKAEKSFQGTVTMTYTRDAPRPSQKDLSGMVDPLK